MRNLILSEPIAAYFTADRQSPSAVARCFTEHATVKDEGHVHTGLDAIRAWKAATSDRYTYTTEPFAVEREEGFELVRAHVAGNFPGSPVDLQYRFRVECGLIASLEITA